MQTVSLTSYRIALLLTALVLLGCTMNVKETSLSENPSYYWLGSGAGSHQSVYSSTDEKVTFRVAFENNMVGADWRFRVQWIAPDGSIYLDEPARTKWGSNSVLFTTLYIADNEPSQMPGKWLVRLWHDGTIIANRSFIIE